jgi:hypothetical protein
MLGSGKRLLRSRRGGVERKHSRLQNLESRIWLTVCAFAVATIAVVVMILVSDSKNSEAMVKWVVFGFTEAIWIALLIILNSDLRRYVRFWLTVAALLAVFNALAIFLFSRMAFLNSNVGVLLALTVFPAHLLIFRMRPWIQRNDKHNSKTDRAIKLE